MSADSERQQPPNNPEIFESLCLDLWKEIWNDPGAQKNGRSGQGQAGVDIFGVHQGRQMGVQCKQKDGLLRTKVTVRELEEEVEKALTFEPSLHTFILATSGPTDTKVQKRARTLTAEHQLHRVFKVELWSWPDIWRELYGRKKLLERLLPIYWPRTSGIPQRTPQNLPFSTLGDLFKGRATELSELGKGEAVAITATPHTLHGLGGMGKTRLAVEFAWRNLARYRAALFVVAESPERLRAELASLAGPRVLGLLDREQMGAAQEQILDVVLDWLRNHPDWLLIFDNVDNREAAAAVEELLPQLTGGHVLITSRLATWSGGIHRTALDTLALAEARAFLLERLGRSGAENEAMAGELAELLGRLPLALEQAAAYMDRQRRSFGKYLAQWKEQRQKVLSWHDEQLMNHPSSVATTWETTFNLLSPAARTVLRLASHLAPEPVAVAMFEEGSAIVAEAFRELCQKHRAIPRWLQAVWIAMVPSAAPDLGDALAELADYSMITLEEETLTVHRLVQEVTRRRIDEGDGKVWVVWALRLVHEYCSERSAVDVRTWPVWDPLRPHAGRVLEHAGKVGDPEPASTLMNELAVLLNSKALTTEAEPLYRRSLAIDEESYGQNHPRVAIRLNNLAQLLKATNRVSEAEPLMHRALAIDEASYGQNHPRVAIDLNNLASLLQATNRVSEAEPLMRRALAIDEESYGQKHPRVATHLNNLAMLLQATNRVSEAEPLMRRSLAIDEESYGQNHPDVAIDLNNLAQLLKATNRVSEAEPLMHRALEILTASLGPEHPWTQRAQGNLDALLRAIP